METRKTRSLCPTCRKEIDAIVFEKDGRMRISKKCGEHGEFEALHFYESPGLYWNMSSLLGRGESGDPDGLVIDVTLDCNMGCPHCFAQTGGTLDDEPSVEDIISRIDGFRGSSVYLCGGEPTLREDLPEIIKAVKDKGKNVVLFTNGVRTRDIDYVAGLKDAGVDLVILSFYSFDREQCKMLYGSDVLDHKMRTLENLVELNVTTEINAIIRRGVNEDQVKKITDYAVENSRTVRIVNFQSMWDLNGPYDPDVFSHSHMIDILYRHYGISEEDFIDSTRFSYGFFEVLRKVFGGSGRRSPKCEVRCYSIVVDNVPVPINRIIDLKEVNSRLLELNGMIEGESLAGRFWLMRKFPFFKILAGVLSNRHARPFALKSLKLAVESMLGKPPSSSNTGGILSIMLGRYHDRHNIDLDFTDTCTLYADNPAGRPESFCLRNMRRSCDNTRTSGE
ncbi:MAG: radical SAM protein [Candidatus Altiarchaeota archaeon]